MPIVCQIQALYGYNAIDTICWIHPEYVLEFEIPPQK